MVGSTGNRKLRTENWFSVPTNWRFVQINVDLLGLEIFFDSRGAEFAAKTRLLVAAPRGFDVSRLHMVDPDDAGAQRFYRTHGLKNIASPDSGSESVRRIVSDLERVSLVVERYH